MIPASASAPSRSARPWWRASLPTIICVNEDRSATRRPGRSPRPQADRDRIRAREPTPGRRRHRSLPARRLRFAPMVSDNDSPHGTAFTVSVDYRHGTTTGISADDRTATVRNLANGNAGAADFVRPGHIFPLIAKDGGVLMRSGHTEAAIDLCRLAHIEPVGAICELVNDDGTVMRGPQVQDFAEAHGLKRISVADLIAYRQAREKLVSRVAEFTVASEIGELKGYAYVTPFDKVHHYAFVYGGIGDGNKVPTRLHRANVLEDVFGGAKPIHAALSHFRAAGMGVLVYLRDGTSGVPTSTLGEDTTPSER